MDVIRAPKYHELSLFKERKCMREIVIVIIIMSDPTKVVVQNCKFWIRVSVAAKVCLKEALLDILHDLKIGGLTKNKFQLHALLTNFKALEEKNLKNVIKPHQWDKLCHTCTGNCPAPCPRYMQTDSQDLDITCIVVLIINLTKLPAPSGTKGWKQALPQIGDATKAAFVLLARKLRNDLIHCSLQQLCTQQHFDDFWQRIDDVLLGLGYNNMILFNRMKTTSLDPYIQDQIDLLRDKSSQLYQSNNTEIKILQADLVILKQATSQLAVRFGQTVNKTDLDSIRTIQQDCTEKLGSMEQDIAGNQIEIGTLKQRVDTMEKININADQDSYQKLSDDLKEQTKKKYCKVNVSFAPKTSSLNCEDAVDRDDIIVDLSLITDAKTVFSIASQTSDIRKVSKLREKQKYNAESEVRYKDIVTSTDDCIIISGVPGCGKTTLIKTLVYKWGCGNLWNTGAVKVDFVFVVFLRDLVRFKENVAITAEKILSFFYPEYDWNKISLSKDINSLLILEGFDELSGKEDLRLKEEHFTSYTRAIYDLFDPNNTRLPFTRIVTSRPGSCSIILETVLLQPYNRKVFEVTGFSDHNINCYIQRHFPEIKQAQEITRKLKETPIVYDMMVIPFYCWGVCYLIKNDVPVEEFSQTYTALYVNLLVLFIRNHGLRNAHRNLKEIFHDSKFKDTCLGLAELAYKLEENGKINFTQEDLPKEIKMEELIRDSGMIIKIESDDFTDSATTFQFLHYTFHEFLVALHMFIKGQPFKKSRNIQIVSMFAGLIGGSLNPSESNKAVQKFSKQFATNNSFELSNVVNEFNPSDTEDEIGITDLLSIVYEFHNTVEINTELVIRHSKSFLDSSYERQCEKFFKTLHAERKLRLGTLNHQFNYREMINEDNDLIPLLLGNYSCNQIFISSNNQVVRDYISNSKVKCKRIFILFNDNEYLTDYAQHTSVLEHFGIFSNDALFECLAPFGDQKGICINKKLVLHYNYPFEEVDVERLVSLADVCKEIVVGLSKCSFFCHQVFNHHPCHNENCVDSDTWDRVTKAQSTLAKLLPMKKFKILKTIKIGASCMKGIMLSPSTVLFSRDETVTGN